jgi:hypothetical protein
MEKNSKDSTPSYQYSRTCGGIDFNPKSFASFRDI